MCWAEIRNHTRLLGQGLEVLSAEVLVSRRVLSSPHRWTSKGETDALREELDRILENSLPGSQGWSPSMC